MYLCVYLIMYTCVRILVYLTIIYDYKYMAISFYINIILIPI